MRHTNCGGEFVELATHAGYKCEQCGATAGWVAVRSAIAVGCAGVSTDADDRAMHVIDWRDMRKNERVKSPGVSTPTEVAGDFHDGASASGGTEATDAFARAYDDLESELREANYRAMDSLMFGTIPVVTSDLVPQNTAYFVCTKPGYTARLKNIEPTKTKEAKPKPAFVAARDSVTGEVLAAAAPTPVASPVVYVDGVRVDGVTRVGDAYDWVEVEGQSFAGVTIAKGKRIRGRVEVVHADGSVDRAPEWRASADVRRRR